MSDSLEALAGQVAEARLGVRTKGMKRRIVRQHAMPNDERRLLRAIAATPDAEAARQEIVKRGKVQFAVGLLDALKPGKSCPACERPIYQTWAYRLFTRVAKWTGAESTVVLAIWQSLGVRDEREARTAISAYQSVGDDIHAAYRDAKALVTWYESANGPGVSSAEVLPDAPVASEDGLGSHNGGGQASDDRQATNGAQAGKSRKRRDG